ncbi:MAG: hypothetical protein J6031_07465 [Bacteroidales bacterium]|nr:hypothetical protein [Bacteroidales bacterium]
MKRNVFIFICGLIISVSALAQTSITAYESNVWNYDEIVIKQYNYPATISSKYSGESGSTVFEYNVDIGANSSTSTQVILKGYRVHDFVIDNDSVFFCGQMGNCGIIGYFDIHDLFFTNGSYYVQDYFNLPNGKTVGDLTKLITYMGDERSLSSRRIVAIGYEQANHFGCIVDVQFFGISTTGYVDASPMESFRDIILVGDNLVTAGFEVSNYLTFRVYDKNFVLTNGIEDYRHTFSNFYGCEKRTWNLKDVLLYPLTENLLASASIWNTSTEGQEKSVQRIHIGEYDLNNLISSSYANMVHSWEISYNNYDYFNRLYGFVYNDWTSSYGILSSSKSSESLFLETDRPISSFLNNLKASSSYEGCVDMGLQGLDLYNTKLQYVMAGRCLYHNNQEYFQIETSGVQSACLPDEECELFENRPSAHKNLREFIDWGFVFGPRTVQPETPETNAISNQCSLER